MSKWLGCYEIVCLVLAILAGIAALAFAQEGNQLGAIAGLALSAFWGTSGLLALTFNSRQARANQDARVVDQVVDYLLEEATDPSGKKLDKAEVIDRPHSMASKSLEGSAPRGR